MKKSSKVKYFGVAAAALLAVAPVVAPAVTATTNEPATVQAATAGTTPDFIADATIKSFGTGTAVYAKEGGVTKEATIAGKTAVDVTNVTPTYQTVQVTVSPAEPESTDGNLVGKTATTQVYSDSEGTVADGDPVDLIAETPYTEKTADGTYKIDAGYVRAEDVTATPTTAAVDAKTTTVKGYFYVTPGAYLATDGAKGTNGTLYIPANGYNLKYNISATVQAADEDAAATVSKTAINTETGKNDANITTALTNGTLNVTGVYTDAAGVEYYSFDKNGAVYLVPAAELTISKGYTVTATQGYITTTKDDVRTYSDSALNNYTGTLIRDKGTQLLVDQKATNANGDVVAYHVSADADTAANTWVDANNVTFAAATLDVTAEKGSVIANASATVYRDKATTIATKDTIAKGETVDYTRVVTNSVTGEVVAYGYKNDNGNWRYVKASAFDENADADVTVSKLPNGTALYSNYKAATIYTNAAATEDSGTKLSTDVNEWSAFEVSKDADGNTIAYRLGKNQWVKAADLEAEQALDGTFDVAAGITLSDAEGTKTGSIENGGNYKVFAVRYINGKQALKLGTDNQWVIAAQGDYYPA
ncbi:hypothetical protein ACFQ5M_02910 [Agrilactobacillus yilanensis]|uniref:Surface layer protein A domain-containing protein n=1 Tax=Agrilactobacillus yilanensis TaxID=2485997 RepID=A0ABW4J5V9_9LACO|nr:hypothetical protein [Agrilactobacillus yilanensis]